MAAMKKAVPAAKKAVPASTTGAKLVFGSPAWRAKYSKSKGAAKGK